MPGQNMQTNNRNVTPLPATVYTPPRCDEDLWATDDVPATNLPNNKLCDCAGSHAPELTSFLDAHPGWDRHKACRGWLRGKRVCRLCDCLVNPVDHHLRCSASSHRNHLPVPGTPPPIQAAPRVSFPEPTIAQDATQHLVDLPPVEQVSILTGNLFSVQDDTLQHIVAALQQMNRTHEICATMTAQQNQLAQQLRADQTVAADNLFRNLVTAANAEPLPRQRWTTGTTPNMNRNRARGLAGASALEREIMSRMVAGLPWLLAGIAFAGVIRLVV